MLSAQARPVLLTAATAADLPAARLDENEGLPDYLHGQHAEWRVAPGHVDDMLGTPAIGEAPPAQGAKGGRP